MGRKNRPSPHAPLPTEVSQIDALELENAGLKAEQAQAMRNAAVSAFRACFERLAAKYKFDADKDVVHYATRQIERK